MTSTQTISPSYLSRAGSRGLTKVGAEYENAGSASAHYWGRWQPSANARRGCARDEVQQPQHPAAQSAPASAARAPHHVFSLSPPQISESRNRNYFPCRRKRNLILAKSLFCSSALLRQIAFLVLCFDLSLARPVFSPLPPLTWVKYKLDLFSIATKWSRHVNRFAEQFRRFGLPSKMRSDNDSRLMPAAESYAYQVQVLIPKRPSLLLLFAPKDFTHWLHGQVSKIFTRLTIESAVFQLKALSSFLNRPTYFILYKNLQSIFLVILKLSIKHWGNLLSRGLKAGVSCSEVLPPFVSSSVFARELQM